VNIWAAEKHDHLITIPGMCHLLPSSVETITQSACQHVCFSACVFDSSKSCAQIWKKYSGLTDFEQTY